MSSEQAAKMRADNAHHLASAARQRAEQTRAKALRALTSLDERGHKVTCLLYTSPSPRDRTRSRMPSSA